MFDLLKKREDNIHSSFLLYFASILTILGGYFFVIYYKLLNFTPKASSLASDILSTFRYMYSPEIEIPLYLLGIISCVVFGSLLYLVLYNFIHRRPFHYQKQAYNLYLKYILIIDVILFIFLSRTYPYANIQLLFSFFITGILIFFLIFFFLPLKNANSISLYMLSLVNLVIMGVAATISVYTFVRLFIDSSFREKEIVPFFWNNSHVFVNSFPLTAYLATFILFFIFLYFWLKPALFIINIYKHLINSRWIGFIVLAVIIYAVSVIVPVTPYWGNIPGFHDYYPLAGPVNDVLHGKTLLINSPSQYGFIMIYLFSFIFYLIPLSYNAIFWVLFFITVAGYFLLYKILRKWIGGLVLPLVGLYLILVEHYFAEVLNLLFFSQSSFLRFGWWVVLLYAFNKQVRYITELILIGISLFWGFDSGLYVLTAYIGMVIVRTFMTDDKLTDKIRVIIKKFAVIAITAGVFTAVISAFTYIRSSRLPNFQEFIGVTPQFMSGWAMYKMDIYGPFLIFAIIYLSLLAYVLFLTFRKKINEEEKKELPIVSFILFYGMMQLVYYLGRSVPAQAHVVILPLILLAIWMIKRLKIYFISQWKSYVFAQKCFVYITLFLFGVTFSIFLTMGNLNVWNTFVQSRFFTPHFDDLPATPQYKSSIDAINSYLSLLPRREVAVVSKHDTDFLLYTKSVNIITSNNLDYFILISQIDSLAEELYNKNPKVIFMDHLIDWGENEKVYLMREYVKKRYHLKRNVGFLDEWVLSESL